MLCDCALSCAACVAVLLAIALPWPHEDRLVVAPSAGAGVEPLEVEAAPGAAGPQGALRPLSGLLVAHFDRSIRRLLRPPFRVLDVGCGAGLVANALGAMPGYTVECLDPSREALRAAENASALAGLRTVRFRRASVYFLPFEDETFDAVVLAGVLEELQDLSSGLEEVSRVLRPGGLVLFASPERSLRSFLLAVAGPEYLPRLLSRRPHDWRLYVRAEELRAGLQGAGRFPSFAYEPLGPSPRAFLELCLLAAGLLAEEALAAEWRVGPGPLAAAYVGRAYKAPPPEAFTPGERAEILANGGPHDGAWIRCRILSNGTKPNTYSVDIEGRRFHGVHATVLRKAFLAPGDLAEVLRTGAAGDWPSWLPCTVLGRGSAANSYEIRVAGQQELSNVPSVALRKVAGRARVQSFSPGDLAEVLALSGPMSGSWLACTILGQGSGPDRYSIRVLSGPPEKQRFPNVHAVLLRKPAAASYRTSKAAAP